MAAGSATRFRPRCRPVPFARPRRAKKCHRPTPLDLTGVFELGARVEGHLVKSVTILMAVCDPPLPMLELAVDSILEQTFHDFEFLILDDGSRRKEILAYLSRRASEDPRIRTECEPHRGLTRTLNLGLAR